MVSDSLVYSLYKIGAVRFGEFRLKSGQTSSIYINLRKIISYPDLLRQVSDAMWNKIEHLTFDLICGVPYTALPIATCLSLFHNIPMIMRRKEKKDYGTKQIIEGEWQQDQHALIIEDIVTTGSSIIETANDLDEAGILVTDVVALIDREQGGKTNLEKKYKLHTVLTLTELLKKLLDSDFLTTNEKHIVEQFLFERSFK